MEEIGKALKVAFDKISDFFDIFDLSFFVSGFFTTLIFTVWFKLRMSFASIEFIETQNIVVIILVCYINGLLSFALGRWIRMRILIYPPEFWRKKKNLPKKFETLFDELLIAHGLENDEEIKKYLRRPESKGPWRLYVRFWAELRNDEKYLKSLAFIRRYWVMAATYDGLSISIFFTILLVLEAKIGLVTTPMDFSWGLCISLLIFLIFLFAACLREANRFVKYQTEEVVASIAASKK